MQQHNYFFILGNHPELSIAEIEALNLGDIVFYSREILLVGRPNFLDAQNLIKEIGGTIKIGEVRIATPITTSPDDLIQQVQELILKEWGESKKIILGISNYTNKKLDLRKIGMTIKKYLRLDGMGVRIVGMNDQKISAPTLAMNRVLEQGVEISLLQNDTEILIGLTRAVQPFKYLSDRDYGRPARDAYSGMLPPKLAQMMINISGARKNEVLLDPFCGSGTVLTEAALLGYEKIYGADISQKALNDAQENYDWIAKKYGLQNGDLRLIETDAKKISTHFASQSVGAIVSEVYLGPQRGEVNIKKTAADLGVTYSLILKEFEKILKKNGSIILALPVWVIGNEFYFLNLNLHKLKFTPIIKKDPKMRLTKKQGALYGRHGQKVWREIIRLQS